MVVFGKIGSSTRAQAGVKGGRRWYRAAMFGLALSALVGGTSTEALASAGCTATTTSTVIANNMIDSFTVPLPWTFGANERLSFSMDWSRRLATPITSFVVVLNNNSAQVSTTTVAVAGNSGTINFDFTLPAGFVEAGSSLDVQVTPQSNLNRASATNLRVICTAAAPAPAPVATTGNASVSLQSSKNPAMPGETVTLTARVSGTLGTPTGSVSFFDGTSLLTTTALSSGTATFATAALAAGSHSITARYGGDSTYAATTSATLVQSIDGRADSAMLRQMQVATTTAVAQASTAVMVSAVDSAIGDAFADAPGEIAPNGTGVRFSYAPGAGVRQNAATEKLDRLTAVARSGYAVDGRPNAPSLLLGYDRATDTQAAGAIRDVSPWRVWGDLRYTGWTTDARFGNTAGGQFNGVSGMSYRAGQRFLVGTFVGYEAFDQSSTTLGARLSGSGWTFGGYAAFKPTDMLRLDVTGGYTTMAFNGAAGAVTANFGGERYLLSAGLTGTHKLGAIELEPSVKLTGLWMRENAYLDSAGTAQGARNAASLRVATGFKAGYPILLDDGIILTPFLGLYANYQSTRDDIGTAAFALDGWSARTTAGLSVRMGGGARISLDGDISGIGSGGVLVYSGRAQLSVPF